MPRSPRRCTGFSFSGALAASLMVLVGAAAGCGPDRSEPPPQDPIRVGVLPDQAEPDLRAQYEPLMDYLGRATGLRLELVIPDSYEQLLDDFHGGALQLAWFGGVTFIQAADRSGARPLVMRDVDREFTSDFLIPAAAPHASLRDLAGARIAFGPRLSTSGHMMPRYSLVQQGIDPETFFAEVLHTEGHDQTALWVQAGEVDLGAVNSVVVESMLQDGRLEQGKVRILARTPPYRNYLWATHPGLPGTIRDLLQVAFLELDFTRPEHAAILKLQGAQAYIPASSSDYRDLRAAARLLGLTEQDAGAR